MDAKDEDIGEISGKFKYRLHYVAGTWLVAMLTQDRLLQALGRFRIFIDGTELFAADLADCASKPMSTNRLRSSNICG